MSTQEPLLGVTPRVGVLTRALSGRIRVPELGSHWPTREVLCALLERRDVATLSQFLGPECDTCSVPAAALAVRLDSSATAGISGEASDLRARQRRFGSNVIETLRPRWYWEFAWDAANSLTMVLLLAMSVISLALEMLWGREKSTGWIDSVAIFTSVLIVVNVTAGIDYGKQSMFASLQQKLEASKKKSVIRGGLQMQLSDADIVVGDVLSFNAHDSASIPADGVLLFADHVLIDESALTGESEPRAKNLTVDPFVCSGTHVLSGAGKLLVVGVGRFSSSGRIREAVYGMEAGQTDSGSPLQAKLDHLVSLIGRAGLVVGALCLVAMLGLGLKDKIDAGDSSVLQYVMESVTTAITVVVVAVPEGLPLAVTLALAISSREMSKEQNLVKTLAACETMGSATTICSDKTGTLTANRMTVQAALVAGVEVLPSKLDGRSLGAKLATALPSVQAALLAQLVSTCTMDESFLAPPPAEGARPELKGNPTECALLELVEAMGYSYTAMRVSTRGRSPQSKAEGRSFGFSSERKMMSYAVPMGGGRWRIFSKGGADVLLPRCSHVETKHGRQPLGGTSTTALFERTINAYAAQAMRSLLLAYRDFEAEPDWHARSATVLNADGSPAFVVETELTCLGVVGMVDPLRPEVGPAIITCRKAGIDVRMVTGDQLGTAVAIAEAAGILRDEDFEPAAEAPTGRRPRRNRAMEGAVLRECVYRRTGDGRSEFDQSAFDQIWPHLRVLARSSPADKLTLAEGLHHSHLYQDAAAVARLEAQGLTIFPDRQVVAMTGDGTNDAPALKRADVGFAMNLSGTQIAKDAADIILLDDNFASIVTAVKWGRNVYDSISKFLQFQLTVNLVACAASIVGVFAHQKPVIAAVQMLWINLIMDSLASLALANEPPTEEVMKRKPTHRSASLLSRQMKFNILGHSLYQMAVLLLLYFAAPEWFGISSGHYNDGTDCTDDIIDSATNGTASRLESCDGQDSKSSVHYTIVFTALVMMTLFNELNARKLHGELNVFEGLTRNPMFLAILSITMLLQVLMTQYGGPFFKTKPLDGVQWAVCLGLGVSSLVVQLPISFFARI